MELFFITRGIKHQVDQFVNDMQAQFFPMDFIDPKTGLKSVNFVQGSLRPIQLWGYAFPEDQLDVVLKTLGLPTNLPEEHEYRKFDLKLAGLRMLLGAEKIPEPNKLTLPRAIRKEWVQITGIGLKRDKKGPVPAGSDNLVHELL